MAGGTLFSLVFHGALITAAVVVTAKAGIASDKTKQEKLQFVEIKKEPPPKPKEPPPPPPTKEVFKAPPPKGFQVLRAPVDIPIKIPDIDLSKKVTNEADFSGKGVKGGVSTGVVGGTARPTNEPYFEFQVEKPVSQIPGTGTPRYPDALRSSGVEGDVQAQFIVNEDGKAEVGSFKVLKATNELFASAVRAALPQMRFYAAEVGGKHVRQLVQQSFQFKLDK
ncbi:MAG TPA: TonB family protein [Gemmatimonadaceae bacterium]